MTSSLLEDKIILVTGINGYIGSHIGLQLLQKGYVVRGTVRSISKAQRLLDGAYRHYSSRLEVVVVPDISDEGAFDEAVRGVTSIVHTASPLNLTLELRDETTKPAVQGTLGLLKSAYNSAGSKLNNIVVTGSVASVMGITPVSGKVYTEEDFDAETEKLAEEAGGDASPNLLYYTSKILAEKALWNFVKEFKPIFSVVSIVPCIAFGPPVQLPATPAELNVSLTLLWKVFSGEMKEIPPAVGTGSFVDVRDVARVHVWAIENSKQSANQRYLVAASKGPVQAFADILRKGYPGRTEIIPKGRPREGYRENYIWGPEEASLSARKAEAVGAISSWIGLEQSVLDAAKELEKFL